MSSDASELSSWMTNLPESLTKIQISNLTIPGSHDTGTYGLTTDKGIAPDRPDLLTNFLVKNFPCIALPAIYRWTKTQNIPVLEQLNCGIRYLDIRVGKCVDNYQLTCAPCLDPNAGLSDEDVMASFYFIHGLYGPKLIGMLNDINEFLQSHPHEVVFIDFQHFYALQKRDHEVLIGYLKKLFGPKICPFSSKETAEDSELRNTSGITLESLWSKGHQVFIYYRDDTCRPDLFWPSASLPNPWANTVKKDYLIEFLEKNMAERPSNSMYVTQCVLTPYNAYVYRNFKSSLRRKLAIPCDALVHTWLAGKKMGAKGPNIVMCDFVEWSAAAIPKLVVSLNK